MRLPKLSGREVKAHEDRSNELSDVKWPNDSGREPTLTSFM